MDGWTLFPASNLVKQVEHNSAALLTEDNQATERIRYPHRGPHAHLPFRAKRLFFVGGVQRQQFVSFSGRERNAVNKQLCETPSLQVPTITDATCASN